MRWSFAALVAAVPFAAGAFDWNARAGLEYTRDDRWVGSSDRTTFPRLDLNLALNATGYFSQPQILSYTLTGQYHRLAMDLPGDRSIQQRIFYRGQLNLLRGPRQPLQFDLHASRADDRVDLQDAALNGSTITTELGGGARYAEKNRPRFDLSYNHLTSTRTWPLTADTERTIQTVTGSVLEGTAVFSYQARYRGNFSEGSYATENYDDHRVDLSAQSRITDGWRASVTDSYFRRDPRGSATVNPWQEYNALSATVLNTIAHGELQQYVYRYTHGLQEAPGAPTVERADQRLGYTIQRALRAPEWRFAASADVSHSQNRLGANSETATAETAGAVVYWRQDARPSVLEARAGPSLGFVQPIGRDPFWGYGAMALGSWQRSYEPTILRLQYGVDFRNDLRSEGRAFTQSASAYATRPLGVGILTGLLNASSTRFDDAVLGARLGRQVNAEASYRLRGTDLRVQVGLTDSVNPALDEATFGDGLLVAPYDTHSRFVLFNGATALTRAVRITGQFRFASADIPDRPSTSEAEARAGIELNYGALRIALEDRYSMAISSGNDVRINQFLIRLYRAFGSLY